MKMKTKTKNIVALGAGVILLMGATAGASVYVMKDQAHERPSTRTLAHETVTFNEPRTEALPPCDDDNIVGKVVGGAAGGIAGSQIGSGKGKTAATIGGAVGGALLGEEYIPTKNVTCR